MKILVIEDEPTGLKLAHHVLSAAGHHTGEVYSEEYCKDQALKAGCDAYIVKPIDTRALSGQIEAVAGKASQQNG